MNSRKKEIQINMNLNSKSIKYPPSMHTLHDQSQSPFTLSQPAIHQIKTNACPQKPPISFLSSTISTFHPSQFKQARRQTQSAIKEFTIPDEQSGFLKVDRMYSALQGQPQRPLSEFQEKFYKIKKQKIKRKTEEDKQILVRRVSQLLKFLDCEQTTELTYAGGRGESDDSGEEI